MTMLHDDPAAFAEDALRGFVDAHAATVRQVPGGVVRRHRTPADKVAVVVGGGSGHYPAFCGLVGPGMADGAVVGNVFTSPSAADAAQVGRHAEAGGGVLMLTGNYAGDVMNFTAACERLAGEGIDARYLVVTDDIASAPVGQEDQRRGIAGDLTVFKVAAAAAERGDDLDAVERLARLANDRTRTLGVAFAGCTLPGSIAPLFSVPEGRMGIGVGIHGEPGIGEVEMPSARGLAELLTGRVLAEAPPQPGRRVAAVLNGLGRTKYEELFVVWATVAERLRAAGLTVVEPEVGELVTSLDMAGCSLTLMWLDEELELLWRAPAAAPAYRKGAVADDGDGGGGDVAAVAQGAPVSDAVGNGGDGVPAGDGVAAGDAVADDDVGPGGRGADGAVGPGGWGAAVARAPGAERRGALVLAAIDAAAREIAAIADELGHLDAVAGDGDHGRGMVRGLDAARDAGAAAGATGADAGEILVAAGQAWAARAGGTSGALWGAMLEAAGRSLPTAADDWEAWQADPVPGAARAVAAALDEVRALGQAELGDKTMVDALAPFHAALAEGGADLATAWTAAADAARIAAEATAELRPRRGRARPLAERSIGHPDPGATSLAVVLRAVVGHHVTEGRRS